jgi:hypothetical protein
MTRKRVLSLPGEGSLVSQYRAESLLGVAILMISRCKPQDETATCLAQAISDGASLVSSSGMTEVSRHRNWVHAKACHTVPTSHDTFVWIDDDQVWLPETLATLVGLCRAEDMAVSGVYVSRKDVANPPVQATILRNSYARRLPDNDYLGAPKLLPCYCGLGFLAVPAWRARWFHTESIAYTESLGDRRSTDVRQVCSAGVIDGQWHADDSSYCRRLWDIGTGPMLAPLSVGHLTPRGARWPEVLSPIWDSENQLSTLALAFQE